MIWCRVAERSQLINRSILSNIRQLVTGDLIKAAIEGVAVLSACRISPCFCCGGAARAAGWLWGAGRALLLCGAGSRRPRVRSSPSPELLTLLTAPANKPQLGDRSSVTIIAAMVERHSKTKYRVLPGEHGRLKFTKAPTGDGKCREKSKNNVINNNSSNQMPVLEPMNNQERLKMPFLTSVCENNTQQLTKCFRCQKYVSDLSKHQCIRPDYRQFFNDSGDLRLLKTKGILKLKRLSSGQKIFNRSFENIWNIKFSCIRHPSHLQVRALTDLKKKINFRFKIIFYTNTNDNKSTSTLGRVGTCHFAALSTHLFSTCNYVKYKIVIYVSDE